MRSQNRADWRVRIERLNACLLTQLPALLSRWLPTGRLEGNEWTALNPRRHDRRLGSFRINVRSGRWADFATGEHGGDPVSLYAYLFTAGRQGVAVRELESGVIPAPHEGAAKAAKAASENADLARRIARARSIYQSAKPIGGAAEGYLLSRGLHPSPTWEPLRAAVLHHRCAFEHSALVAPITGSSGAVEGIQRTFLTAEGRKLPVADPKLSLGTVRGGAIRLCEPGSELILCEGLEDGLSLAQELPGASVWAAPGAGLLCSMRLPASVSRVTIAADNDTAGEQAAIRAAKLFASEGRQIRIMRPDPAFKDWNDQLCGSAL